ncbi:hypothetical protein HPB51_000031 [Rhipicephalus microplus]|uniref:Peptidase M13 N-terminal domain-containing protein n=1 Tax=Rhipicephalus microplus TaxID=6941 RepID=A0A9J6DXK9_RHIMP|nr:hypothetical protein HPB51_000031 [Rhipicephalus microplus]
MSFSAKSTSQEKAPNADSSATSAASVAQGGSSALSKPPAQDKLVLDERRSRQSHRRQSKAQRGPRSSMQSNATKTPTNPDVQVGEERKGVRGDEVIRTTGLKRLATTDVLRQPRGSQPALSVTTERAKAAASGISPVSPESTAFYSSNPAALTPFRDKGSQGRKSLKALDKLLKNRAVPRVEPSPATAAAKKYRLPYKVKVLLAVSVIAVIVGFTLLLLNLKPKRHRVEFCVTKGEIDKITSLPLAVHMRDMFNAVLRITPPVTLDELVLVSDLSVFNSIMKVLNRVNDTTLLRHVAYLFAQTYGAVAYPRGFLLVLHGSEAQAKEARPRFCARRVEPSFKLLVAALTSVAQFSEEERRSVVERLEEIVQVAMNKTGASSWLDSRIKKAALEKLSNVQTVVWPSQKFLSPSRLEEVYKRFPEDATSFTEFWIEARRSQRLLFGTDASTEELLLGNNYKMHRLRAKWLTVPTGKSVGNALVAKTYDNNPTGYHSR